MPADQEGSESVGTVVLALAANLGIAFLKLLAGLLSGSGALLSEAAHSAGDSTTEVLLLTALHRSDSPPDRTHPFGYGKESYFWSLLAAMATFTSGALFSLYEGVHTIVERPDLDLAWLTYVVLAVSAVLEGTSLARGVRQARTEARKRRLTLRTYLDTPDDPTVKSVVLEDTAALIGLALAGLGVGLHQLTGSAVWDGVASILIGLLLVGTSFALAQTCKSLLIGRQADERLLRAVHGTLEAQDEIDDVVDMLTMVMGTGKVLLCARVDLAEGLTGTDVEHATTRIDALLRETYPDLSDVFLEARPRHDAGTRAEVKARYGRTLTD